MGIQKRTSPGICQHEQSLEWQNGAFKHKYLQKLQKHSLSAMLRILIEEFLPDKYERYVYS